MILQQALAEKVVDFSQVMILVVRLINFALQHCLFETLSDAAFRDLLLYADVAKSCSDLLNFCQR